MPETDETELLHAALDAYTDGAVGSALQLAFRRWAGTADCQDRSGVVVALDASGSVVAAMDTRAPVGVTRLRVAKHLPQTHTHGWARVAGTWMCVQDYYAAGDAPETGCGQTHDLLAGRDEAQTHA